MTFRKVLRVVLFGVGTLVAFAVLEWIGDDEKTFRQCMKEWWVE